MSLSPAFRRIHLMLLSAKSWQGSKYSLAFLLDGSSEVNHSVPRRKDGLVRGNPRQPFVKKRLVKWCLRAPSVMNDLFIEGWMIGPSQETCDLVAGPASPNTITFPKGAFEPQIYQAYLSNCFPTFPQAGWAPLVVVSEDMPHLQKKHDRASFRFGNRERPCFEELLNDRMSNDRNLQDEQREGENGLCNRSSPAN
jgi:hypothetical protein